MAENNEDVPPIPLPSAGAFLPPVEPPPATPAAATPPAAPTPPTAPAPPTPPVPPGAPQPLPPVSAARPDPYAHPTAYGAPQPQPGAYAAPQAYVQPQAGYAPPGAVPPAYGAPGYGAQGYAYTPAAAGPPQGMSIASMIIGIAAVLGSFVSLGLLPAIAAVILGHLGQRRQPYARPFWLTGLITGYIALGISVITGLFFIVAIIVSAMNSASYGY